VEKQKKMAETRKIILEVDVNDSDVGALRRELDKTAESFSKVDKEAGKTAKSIDDVKDNGGAIAILDSLTGGLATRFRDAYEASSLFNVSLKSMRTALIATGIGALVVSIGLMVAYWDEIQDAITGVNAKLEKQLEYLNRAQELTQSRLDIIEKELELSELQGKANEELQKQRIALLQKLQEEQQAEIKVLEAKAARLKATGLELKLHERIQRAILNSAQAGLGDRVVAEQKLELSQQYLELQKLINQAKGEELDTSIKLYQVQNPEGSGAEGQENAPVTALNFTPSKARDRVEQYQAYLASLLDAEQGFTDGLNTQANARVHIAEFEAQGRMDAMNEWLGLAQSVSMLIGRETAAGKALAVAATGVSTYLSAQKAYESQLSIPTPDAPIRAALAAGVAVAAGLKNVQAILSVKVPNSGGVSMPSVGGRGGAGGGVPSPQFNVVGSSGVNQLAGVVGDRLAQPVKAYVTMGDVNTAQQLEVDAVRESSLG
jgi:hypothetical protein